MVGEVRHGRRAGAARNEGNADGAGGPKGSTARTGTSAVMQNAPGTFPDHIAKLVSSTSDLARQRIDSAEAIKASNRKWDSEVDQEIALINRCADTDGVKFVASQCPRGELAVLLAWEEMSRLLVLGVRDGRMTMAQGTHFGDHTADGKKIYLTHFTDLAPTSVRPRTEQGQITFEGSLVKFDNVTAEVVLKGVERILRDNVRPTSLAMTNSWSLTEHDVGQLTSRFRRPT